MQEIKMTSVKKLADQVAANSFRKTTIYFLFECFKNIKYDNNMRR